MKDKEIINEIKQDFKMKDEEKQIEEMAKDIGISFQLAGTTRFGAVAEELISIGWIKPTKDSVVLSREELEEKYEPSEKFMSVARELEDLKQNLEDKVVRSKDDYEAMQIKIEQLTKYAENERQLREYYCNEARKETAEKCWQIFLLLVVSKLDEYWKKLNDANRLDAIREVLHKLHIEYQDELATQFGVEIKE